MRTTRDHRPRRNNGRLLSGERDGRNSHRTPLVIGNTVPGVIPATYDVGGYQQAATLTVPDPIYPIKFPSMA